ncbi:MAG: hypothetical protein R3D68_11995 [Hyphomicrobiaceae bacterium]
MTPADSLLTHWYFHIPNLMMAALIYTLIGRYLLELFFARTGKDDPVIVRVFRSVTDPFLKLIRLVTPAIVPNGVLIVFAIAWLMAARMAWFLTCVAAGMRANVLG